MSSVKKRMVNTSTMCLCMRTIMHVCVCVVDIEDLTFNPQTYSRMLKGILCGLLLILNLGP